MPLIWKKMKINVDGILQSQLTEKEKNKQKKTNKHLLIDGVAKKERIKCV